MKRVLRLYAIIALSLLPHTQVHACACQYLCGFMQQVHTMFSAYPPGTVNWEEQVVIIKAAYIDSIPNSYGGSRVKLLTQFYGRPVKDTFNFLPSGTDCDLYLGDFHKRAQDTLFLILHRTVLPNSWLGDTVKYSLTMCGRHFAVVRNDSAIEDCGMPNLTASAMADSLRHTVHALGVDASNTTPALYVYPNPVADKLTMEGAQGAIVLVVNSTGQSMMQFAVTTNKQVLDVSSLPAGMYILQLTDAKGSRRAMSIMKKP